MKFGVFSEGEVAKLLRSCEPRGANGAAGELTSRILVWANETAVRTAFLEGLLDGTYIVVGFDDHGQPIFTRRDAQSAEVMDALEDGRGKRPLD